MNAEHAQTMANTGWKHDEDERFLARSVEIASRFRDDALCTPFGAVVARDGVVVGESHSRVVELKDPSAHAEVLAIRQACTQVDSHMLSGATLYCSGFPCPLCLSLARWAGISRIAYSATLSDSASVGFEDAGFYRDLERGLDDMDVEFLAGPAQLRAESARLLREWKNGWVC